MSFITILSLVCFSSSLTALVMKASFVPFCDENSWEQSLNKKNSKFSPGRPKQESKLCSCKARNFAHTRNNSSRARYLCLHKFLGQLSFDMSIQDTIVRDM